MISYPVRYAKMSDLNIHMTQSGHKIHRAGYCTQSFPLLHTAHIRFVVWKLYFIYLL